MIRSHSGFSQDGVFRTMTRGVLALAILIAALLPQMAKADTVYNLSDDFSTTSNPNGPWQFGWVSTMGGSLNLFDSMLYPAYGGDRWNDSTISNMYWIPQVWKNNSDTTLFNWVEPGDVALHPGPSGELATVRFTAPVDGTYTLSGYFDSYNRAYMSKYIYSSGSTAGLLLTENNSWYNDFSIIGLAMQVGDFLDFVVGPTAWNSIAGGDTILSLNITGSFDTPNPPVATPEPGTVMLLGLGFVGLAYIRRIRA